MLKRLVAFLLLSLTIPFAPCQTTSQLKPLTDEEKVQILQQLMALRDLYGITLPGLDAEIAKLQATVEEKQKVLNDTVAADAEKLAAAEKERDTWKSKAEFYKNAAQIKPMGGAKRFFCKLFTLGIAACR